MHKNPSDPKQARIIIYIPLLFPLTVSFIIMRDDNNNNTQPSLIIYSTNTNTHTHTHIRKFDARIYNYIRNRRKNIRERIFHFAVTVSHHHHCSRSQFFLSLSLSYFNTNITTSPHYNLPSRSIPKWTTLYLTEFFFIIINIPIHLPVSPSPPSYILTIRSFLLFLHLLF